jgi:hypothetical protein
MPDPTPDPTPDFAWLRDPRGRPGALRLVGAAIRKGWLDGPDMGGHQAALISALAGLLNDPTATHDEVLAACRIILMTQE